MRKEDARVIYAKLVAANPKQYTTPETEDYMVSELMRLDSAEEASVAVDEINRAQEGWPSVRLIRETYQAVHKRRAEAKQLREPPVGSEQRRINLAMGRANSARQAERHRLFEEDPEAVRRWEAFESQGIYSPEFRESPEDLTRRIVGEVRAEMRREEGKRRNEDMSTIEAECQRIVEQAATIVFAP